MGGAAEERAARRRVVTLAVAVVATFAVLVYPVAGLAHGWRAVTGVYQHLTTAPDLDTGRPAGDVDLPPQSHRANHAFLETQEESEEPVRWDPCSPIPYVVDFEGAPPGTETILLEAMRMITRVSGIEFRRSTGVTRLDVEDGDFSRAEVTPMATISWATPRQNPDVAGYAGYARPIATPDVDGRLWYTLGDVVLNARHFRELPELVGLRQRAAARAILAHELAHLAGLDHVDHPGELMNEEPAALLSFGPGDIAGLQALGEGECRAWAVEPVHEWVEE